MRMVLRQVMYLNCDTMFNNMGVRIHEPKKVIWMGVLQPTMEIRGQSFWCMIWAGNSLCSTLSKCDSRSWKKEGVLSEKIYIEKIRKPNKINRFGNLTIAYI